MGINMRNDGVVPVVGLSGNIDLNTSQALRAALDELLATGHVHFLVNLLGTTYLDSTALSILASVGNQVLRAGGMLGLVFNQPQIDHVFRVTGLKDMFPTFLSQGEALAAAKTWVKVVSEGRSSPTLFR